LNIRAVRVTSRKIFPKTFSRKQAQNAPVRNDNLNGQKYLHVQSVVADTLRTPTGQAPDSEWTKLGSARLFAEKLCFSD
jgi:hypothetical protein